MKQSRGKQARIPCGAMPFHDFLHPKEGHPIFGSIVGHPYFYVLPYRRRFILYRPLQRLAFLANRAMAQLAADKQAAVSPSPEPGRRQAAEFLKRVGFFSPICDPSTVVQEKMETCFQPSIAVLLLTTSCNLRCSYCYASAMDRRDAVLPLSSGMAAIDWVCRNAKEKGESQFSLCFHGGGEPTLAIDLLRQLVDYARQKDLPAQIQLSSNGVWTRNERDWILANIDDIGISCDGLPEVHDRQRPSASGGGSFSEVFDVLHEMDRRKVCYGIRLTVAEDHIDTLPRSIEFLCQETDCGTFQAEPAFSQGRARNGRQAVRNHRRFVQAFLSAYDIAIRHQRHLFYSGARPLVLTPTFCRAPDSALIVNNEGRLTACYEVFHSSLELAPLFFLGEVTPSGEIKWDEKKRSRLQDLIDERRRLCRGCFCYWHCAADCPAKTMTPDGRGHLQFGVRCRINREITKGLLIRFIHQAGGIWQGEREPTKPFAGKDALMELAEHRCFLQE